MATSAAHLQPAAAQAAEPAPLRSRLNSVLLLLRYGTVMAAALGAATLPTSSLFVVRAVDVLGTSQIPAAEVVALSGLHQGDRLFAVPAAEIIVRVLRHPRISRADVRVGRGGQIVIRVSERIPYAAFPLEARYLILDRTGVVIDDQPSAGTLPVVTAAGFVPPWMRPGDRLPGRGVEHALAALDRLPAAVIAPGTRLRVEPQGDLVLFTADGITVRLGPLRGLKERAALMAQVLAAVRTRGLAMEYIDLRFSGNVVMKPAPGPAAGDAGGR